MTQTLGFVARRGVVLLALLGLQACAGHADRTLEARSALDAGRPKAALQLYNEELEVKSEKEVPEDIGGDNTLLILDRSMILQQLEKYSLASRDLELADKQIEVLDFSRNALDSIGKYMFSDDTGPYKAPPYEKLMINTMNMVNYLARGDLNGARIEARRLAVMQKYLRDKENPAQAMLGPGSYLAGFTFEKSGKPDQALRYYDEALAFGNYQSLREAVTRLSNLSGYSTPRLRKLIDGQDPTKAERHDDAPDLHASASIAPVLASTLGAQLAKSYDFDLLYQQDPEQAAAAGPSANAADDGTTLPGDKADDSGEIFAIVSFGRVPAKFAKRIPIGLALTYASAWMSPGDQQRANELAMQGLVTWINYPELGKARGTYDNPGFGLDGDWQQLEGALAVDREVRSAYDHARGAIIAAAITRMIARVVAGNVAGKAAGDDDALALLLNLGTQATLTAVDTPDTRSWATLPARIAFGRARVAPGKHQVLLTARGHKLSETVDVPANGFKVVAMTVLE